LLTIFLIIKVVIMETKVEDVVVNI
jgi:hypothetical protein